LASRLQQIEFLTEQRRGDLLKQVGAKDILEESARVLSCDIDEKHEQKTLSRKTCIFMQAAPARR